MTTLPASYTLVLFSFSVKVEVSVELPVPPMCIWAVGGSKTERCFLDFQQVKYITCPRVLCSIVPDQHNFSDGRDHVARY